MEENVNKEVKQFSWRAAYNRYGVRLAAGNRLPYVNFPGLGIAALFGLFFVFNIAIGIVLYALGTDVISSSKGMRIMAVVQDVFVFIVPSIAAAIIATRLPANFLTINVKPRLSMILMGLFVLIVSMPAMEYMIYLNEHITFPESMKGLEESLRSLEESARDSVENLAGGTSVGDLIMGLLLVGLLTGLAEELFFRGAMQNLFMSTKMNKHLCIWLVAIIFSFMHGQFYGFFPRIFMGAFFGYLLWWSGSVWTGVCLHAINNSIIVVYGWVLARGGEVEETGSIGETVETLGAADYTIIAVSVALTIFGLIILSRSAKSHAALLSAKESREDKDSLA